ASARLDVAASGRDALPTAEEIEQRDDHHRGERKAEGPRPGARRARHRLGEVEDDPGEDTHAGQERPVEGQRLELGPDEGDWIADVVARPARIAGGLARRDLAEARRPAPVPDRGREDRLEPEERPDDEEDVEGGPADEDAREGAVGRSEADGG